MELVDLLTKNLGVSAAQAQGGAGLLFKLAKEKLGGGDFGKVAAAVPGIDSLIGAAPTGGILGGLASLAGGFSKLGLDAGMIGKFVPIILSFVQSKGGDAVKGILEKVLK